MKNKAIFILIVVVSALVISCKEKKLPKTDPELVQSITEGWSDALNKHNIDTLNNFYADVVLMYGEKQNKYRVLHDKANFIKNYPDFKHSIKDISPICIGDGLYEVSFTKNVLYNNNTIEIGAKLVLQKQESKWLIISESDDPTEAKLKREKQKAEDAAVRMAQTQTVQFEQTINLTGKLKTSNYTDVNDNEYTIYILSIDYPLNVIAPDENYKPQTNITEVQIGFDDKETPEKYIGKTITVNGEIYGEETIHDRRPVVMIRAIIK